MSNTVPNCGTTLRHQVTDRQRQHINLNYYPPSLCMPLCIQCSLEASKQPISADTNTIIMMRLPILVVKIYNAGVPPACTLGQLTQPTKYRAPR